MYIIYVNHDSCHQINLSIKRQRLFDQRNKYHICILANHNKKDAELVYIQSSGSFKFKHCIAVEFLFLSTYNQTLNIKNIGFKCISNSHLPGLVTQSSCPTWEEDCVTSPKSVCVGAWWKATLPLNFSHETSYFVAKGSKIPFCIT